MEYKDVIKALRKMREEMSNMDSKRTLQETINIINNTYN